MNVTQLNLHNFRNHTAVEVSFVKGLNVLVGPNGAGKTNIVEAIHMLAFASSFRSKDGDVIVQKGKPKAHIEAVLNLPQKSTVEFEISGKGKVITVNGKILRKTSELNNLLNITTFVPEDVFFFDREPKNRRRFLDERISKENEQYLSSLITYEKLLKERNALLKLNDAEERLEIVTRELVKTAEKIVLERQKYAKKLESVVNRVIGEIAFKPMVVALNYVPSLKPLKNFQETALKMFEELKTKERVLQTTTIGPHRDDLTATLLGKDVKDHASQGQKRIVAIALKIAPYFVEVDPLRKPIIILDDVLSELDEKHQERLLDLLNRVGQAFITTTKYENYAAAIYDVSAGEITRRNLS
jgi:DNA replication and repair protein RecF